MSWEYTCPRCGKIIREATPSRLKSRVRRHERELHKDEEVSISDVDDNMDKNVNLF